MILGLLSCESERLYNRTSIPLPSNEAIYTFNSNIDSSMVNVKKYKSEIPHSIINHLMKNTENHIKRPLNDNDLIKKSNYKINDEISLFDVIIISENPILGHNYIGIYKIGNFDYFTSTYADSISLDINSEIIRFKETENEYLITYKLIINGQENFQRLTFRDTLNQLQWYKIEM